MAGQLPGELDYVTRLGQWPYTVQGVLQFLGIFHGGAIQQKTKCYMCREKRNLDASCDVCESLQWNSEGKIVVYDQADIVSGVINNSITRLITILVLVGLLCGMCYDMIILVHWLWGKQDDVLHLVSFLTFWIPLLSVPGCCLIAHVCNVIQDYSMSRSRKQKQPLDDDAFDHWYRVFHANFVARRIQYMSSTSSKSTKRVIMSSTFLALCFSWAIANLGFECLNYFISKYHKYHDFLNYFHLGITGLSLLMFGCFCYVIHLLRDSLDCEYNQVLGFVLNNQNQVDKCRHRIVELYRDYRILRKFIRSWMILILACATLGLTVHVSWNYAVYTRLRNDPENESFESEHYHKVITAWTNILIGSEKFMILFLPLLALGGFNIENSWRQFSHAIVLFRVEKYNSFWKKLSKIVYEIHPPFSSATVTIAWCVFGWFFGLHLGEQNTNYESGPVGV
ncbi:uncharacterized protein [Amphiura filiformis]|uniref:uncharacterized protein n=1 Tax=Amphiura filiformis TaxID=82378 RepID=UPI003B21789E